MRRALIVINIFVWAAAAFALGMAYQLYSYWWEGVPLWEGLRGFLGIK
jgi:hypothetical protein